MSKLGKSLAREGYEISNWGYRSLLWSIEKHAQDLATWIQRTTSTREWRRIHIVAHSMGCIVARQALLARIPEKFGRIVMLAPPNNGSHIASRFAGAIGWVCRPLGELSDTPDSFVNRMDEPHGIEVGVVAASFDRVVPLKSTFLTCQKDHIVLPSHHGTLPWRDDSARQVASFLKNGSFQR